MRSLANEAIAPMRASAGGGQVGHPAGVTRPARAALATRARARGTYDAVGVEVIVVT